MSMIGWITGKFGKSRRGGQEQTAQLQRSQAQAAYWMTKARELKAKYDAAEAGDYYSEMHWSNADLLSPDSANIHSVRRRLRSRSRYESGENNSYLKGIALTLANDFTGSGPRLKITDKRLSRRAANLIEEQFSSWCRQTDFKNKLWRLRLAKFVDGESFAVQFTNRKLTHPVKVDWHIIEADQVTTLGVDVDFRQGAFNQVDGIRFDEWDQPVSYHVMNRHPGATYQEYIKRFNTRNIYGGRWVPARFVIHWLRKDRPWVRGIPETTPALPLCSVLRRYTQATLHAAETAANFSGVLETEAPPFPGQFGPGGPSGDPTDYEDFDTVPIDKNMFTVVPFGYKLTQLEAQQPTETHDKFVDSVLREMARSLNMPFNVASGFSGGYNFASGTLDRQLYNGAIKHEREHSEYLVLDPVFAEFWFEAIRIPDLFGQGHEEDPPNHVWLWDQAPEHADPVALAKADQIYVDMGQKTDADIQMKRFGRSRDELYDMLEEEQAEREERGIETTPEPPPGFGEEAEDGEGDEEEQEEVPAGEEG